MWSTIKGLIKLASLIGSGQDLQHLMTQYHGKQQAVLNYVPYGLQINPPVSADIAVLQLNIEGQEDAPIAMITDMNNRALKLASGEAAIGIPAGTTFIHFLANGNIEFIINGNYGSQGTPDFLCKYNELLTAFNSLKNTVNTHTHAVTTAPGTTATALPQATADMSGSKLSGVEVPNV